ncbi:TonB-dependent receptor [Bacteroides helcogenes P 36-108]|uniref:TonB-dependent receptor n=1 Tax=Bacteroides helcogenes (strain ATCC 35417 / DSM 20613 / JCM 6297 / CCUG 15421 / P 36-108) TaxID=693979 RepID=E6SPF3_BACT6|nr:TonB-dependent receptor [Bacteroides helcogenes P 36-108]
MLLLFGTANATMADEKANVTKQGTVRGRIIDATKQTLPGASIYIEKLHTGVTSDVNGFYTFSNLDPGTYTVKVSYVGYSPVELKITIPAGHTLEKDVTLNEGVELQEVVVGGAFQGQRRAINSQKSSLGISNVVSADQVGKFPDSNIGDALKRISGINVQYDQGEARFGQVRGTSADLSSVTINGNRIPSAEGDTRNVQLDLIPSDMIQTIEVNKVVTPDMDADAIGGSINLVTKNSPYKRFISATAGTGYNRVSEKAQLNLGFTYGDRFFNDKLGVMLSASYQNSPSGSDDVEFVWDKDANSGEVTLTDYQIRQYYLTRERQSYSAALDYVFNANHKLTFKGIFNNRNDWENRYRTTIKGINLEKDDNGNDYCSINDKGTVRFQTKGGSPDNRNARLERQRTMDFTLGGEHLFGKLSMDWSLNYAKASEERPNERYIDYQLKKQKFDLDLTDERRPLFTPQDGSSMTMTADLLGNKNFSLKEVTEQQEDIQEKDLKAKFDFKLPLKKGFYANALRFGAKMVHKTKDKTVDFYEYTPLDETGFDQANMAALTNQTRSGYMPGSQYAAGNFISKEYLGNLDLNNSTLFEKAQVPAELATNFNAKETVTAGYLRYDQKFGKKWDLMLGLRLENTHVKYSGSQYDADSDETTRTPYESHTYLNVLPSVLVKHDVNDDFKLRASFTNTISRPKYAALAPNISIKRSDNSISVGNPELSPTISYNFDLNGEYYFKSIGLVSAGVFYKKINDFIVDQTLRNYQWNGNSYTKFSQPRNSGDADLLGVELAYQRDFGFIAPALKCIGFYGTYTYSYSRVNNFNFEGRENESGLRLPGSPEHTANASLFFEKYGLNIRWSYNYASAFIDEMGSEKFYDRYYDAVNYMDVNASYTFGRKLKTTFYAEATNLLNQPLRYYQGSKDRTMQSEHYGVRVNAGVKINF